MALAHLFFKHWQGKVGDRLWVLWRGPAVPG